MTTDEFILSVNPEPAKQGVRIDKVKYVLVRETSLHNLRTHGSRTFTQSGDFVEAQLQNNFDGSVMCYYITVKLDLEECGELRRVPRSRPQQIEIA